MGRIVVGTSGWNYKHWSNGVFYPAGLPASKWLDFYVRHFETVELNNSFYRLPTEQAFQRWAEQASPGFVFAVKASRFLTHMKRLKDPDDPLELFFSRARRLGNHLGPILFQLPPNFKCDTVRLETFLVALRRNKWGKKSRSVLEVRDNTWLSPKVYRLLDRFGVAMCVTKWREIEIAEPVTSCDFVYVRRHYGNAGDGNYSHDELDRDAAAFKRWARRGRNVYVYFNNDWKGYAVENAQYIRDWLKSSPQRRRERSVA
jgi:uncharacterized protein YecE (DUF72 family)